MTPLVSVVICTHNRADLLPMALRSLVEQQMPKEQFEVILVDNRSTDDTRAVAEHYAHALNLRYVYEAQLGLSYARNTGWRNARALAIAYLDDDAAACPGWLNTIVGVFECGDPQVGCVGGKVEPLWETVRPAWLSDNLAVMLSAIDWSETPHALVDLKQEWLVGANFAFRAEVLQAIGGFVDGLDRVGTQLLSGGDVYIQRQIMQAGYTCYYEPAMQVRHFTPRSRLTQPWFLKRCYWQGISDIAMQMVESAPSRQERYRLISGKLRWILRSPQALSHLLLPQQQPQPFLEKCWAVVALGQIVGLLRLKPRRA